MGYYSRKLYNCDREKCHCDKKREWRPTLRYMLEDEGYSEEEIFILSEEHKKRAQKEIEYIDVEAIETDVSEELDEIIKNKKDEIRLLNNEIEDLKRERQKTRKRNGLFKLISQFISKNDEMER